MRELTPNVIPTPAAFQRRNLFFAQYCSRIRQSVQSLSPYHSMRKLQLEPATRKKFFISRCAYRGQQSDADAKSRRSDPIAPGLERRRSGRDGSIDTAGVRRTAPAGERPYAP